VREACLAVPRFYCPIPRQIQHITTGRPPVETRSRSLLSTGDDSCRDTAQVVTPPNAAGLHLAVFVLTLIGEHQASYIRIVHMVSWGRLVSIMIEFSGHMGKSSVARGVFGAVFQTALGYEGRLRRTGAAWLAGRGHHLAKISLRRLGSAAGV